MLLRINTIKPLSLSEAATVARTLKTEGPCKSQLGNFPTVLVFELLWPQYLMETKYRRNNGFISAHNFRIFLPEMERKAE